MFDYEVIKYSGKIEDVMKALKRLGKEGWELVCSLSGNLILKRDCDCEEQSNDKPSEIVICIYSGWCDYKGDKIQGETTVCTKTFKDSSSMCQSAHIVKLGESDE